MVCKKDFMPKNLKQRICSKECYKERAKITNKKTYNKHRNPRLFKFQKVCRVCNKIFKTNVKNTMLCSKECSEKVNINKFVLFNVFERDNFRCAYCGKTSYEDGVKLIVEHIFPRSKGGTNDNHNVITACNDCNSRKKDKVMDWNIILTLWQVVDERNKRNNIAWDEIKSEFDKKYKIN